MAVASGGWDAGQDERIAAELGRLEALSRCAAPRARRRGTGRHGSWRRTR
ncbi:hypothetical protein ACFQ60_28280 [Streptomyces zhihengii]